MNLYRSDLNKEDKGVKYRFKVEILDNSVRQYLPSLHIPQPSLEPMDTCLVFSRLS